MACAALTLRGRRWRLGSGGAPHKKGSPGCWATWVHRRQEGGRPSGRGAPRERRVALRSRLSLWENDADRRQPRLKGSPGCWATWVHRRQEGAGRVAGVLRVSGAWPSGAGSVFGKMTPIEGQPRLKGSPGCCATWVHRKPLDGWSPHGMAGRALDLEGRALSRPPRRPTRPRRRVALQGDLF